jgi:flagellar hook protein FlgE
MGINSAMYNGVSGLNSFSSAISVVGDNVANSNTTGFKTNSVHFGDMVNKYYAMNSNDTESEGAGSMVLGISTDYAQGLIANTSNWSDLCISGNGFFEVSDGASTYYTRDGGFHLNATGNLVNLQGLEVQSTAGASINVGTPASATPAGGATDYWVGYRVDTDGTLYGLDNTNTEREIATLHLATFSNKDGLARQGNNLYIAGPEVGTVTFNDTNPEMFGQVVDYSLESSNVDLAKQMVDMIIYQASYNANSKTITTCKDMIDATINMVR